MTEYDDDGTTEAYRRGESATTSVAMNLTPKGDLTISILPTEGRFNGFVADKSTTLLINATAAPKSVAATVGGRRVKLTKAASLAEFEAGTDCYFYNEAPELNRFATPGSSFADVKITKIRRYRSKSPPPTLPPMQST